MAGALGHLSTLQRDYEQAAELLEEALARQRELGNDVAVSLAYNFWADPAQPGRSRPRGAAVHRGSERGPTGAADRIALLVSLYDLAIRSQPEATRPARHSC
jgi:hypothetical protein